MLTLPAWLNQYTQRRYERWRRVVVLHLHRHPDLMAIELSRLTHLPVGRLHVLLARMVRDGWATTRVVSAGDGLNAGPRTVYRLAEGVHPDE